MNSNNVFAFHFFYIKKSNLNKCVIFCLFSGTMPMPPSDLFTPQFAPTVLPSYQFSDHHVKYPSEYPGLPKSTGTPSMSGPAIPNSPSRTPPRSPSESGSDSSPEEVRSAFVPIRLNTLPPQGSAVTPSSSSPGRTISRRPTDGVKSELKAPTTLISQRITTTVTTPKRSPSPTKITSPPVVKAVWRPY